MCSCGGRTDATGAAWTGANYPDYEWTPGEGDVAHSRQQYWTPDEAQRAKLAWGGEARRISTGEAI